jgi:hypothetical protein
MLTRARKLALGRLHLERSRRTALRLNEALDRMEMGIPEQLTVPFKWTKANLSREAGVHIATIFSKTDGNYRWSRILSRFEALRRTARNKAQFPDGSSEARRKNSPNRSTQIRDLKERENELARQAEIISELRAKIRDYEKRESHIQELMQMNAALRSRCQQTEKTN